MATTALLFMQAKSWPVRTDFCSSSLRLRLTSLLWGVTVVASYKCKLLLLILDSKYIYFLGPVFFMSITRSVISNENIFTTFPEIKFCNLRV